MVAIYKRELHSLFTSMLIWVYFAIFALFTGIFSSIYNFYGRYSAFESSLGYLILIVMIAVPILTMRSLSDERKNKTDILLMTLPVKTRDYVIAKYLSLVTVNFITSLFCAVIPLILKAYTKGIFNMSSAVASIFSFFICTSALFAVGLFMSSLTDSPVVSALLSFGAMLLIYFMSAIVSLLPNGVLPSFIFMSATAFFIGFIAYLLTKNYIIASVFFAVPEVIILALLVFFRTFLSSLPVKICGALSLTDRLTTVINSSILDISSIIYFITVAALFVFFAIIASDRRKYA